MTGSASGSTGAWGIIENEKRRDRFVRRVSIVAWSVTLALVLLVAALVTVQIVEMTKLTGSDMNWLLIIGSAMPLVDVLWKLSLLVAVLSTVGIFLRLRTASLAEIQLRLATLEDMLASRPDPQEGEE